MANLQIGSRGSNVQQLQQQLQQLGFYHGSLDGIYGPQTQAAIRLFQGIPGTGLKVDGIYGPKTTAALAAYGAHPSNPTTPTTPTNPTAPIVDPNADPGMTLPGDYTGMGYSQAEIDALNAESMAELDPYYKQDADKATADFQGDAGAAQAAYQSYLNDSSAKFAADKDTQDVTAANNGVLFSTGRVQKLNNLQNTYANADAAKKAAVGNQISSAARDYQYKYGNDKANSLSDFYKLGGNTYDAQGNKAVVGNSGVSSVYNPSASNYYGTQRTAQKYAASLRTGNKLANKTNKGLLNGYANQL